MPDQPAKVPIKAAQLEPQAFNVNELTDEINRLHEMLNQRQIDRYGLITRRILPGDSWRNPRVLGVMPLLMGRARLCVGRLCHLRGKTRQSRDWGSFDDIWDYPSIEAATKAMNEWNPDQQSEPNGWIRHPRTGRRRPDDGNPCFEVVRL